MSDQDDPGSVLSEAQLREVYGKAVTRGLRGRVTVTGELVHAVVDEVLQARDRELARLRQRLALAAAGLPEVRAEAALPSQHCHWLREHTAHNWVDEAGARWACRRGEPAPW